MRRVVAHKPVKLAKWSFGIFVGGAMWVFLEPVFGANPFLLIACILTSLLVDGLLA